MRKTPLIVAALAALTLGACSDSGTDQTQTQSIDQNTEPAMQENAPAAVPEQTDEYAPPAAPAD
ncbi:MAG: hypothetical protein K8H74_10210 [Notoacmeibacter sp.]|nr:hypothetical protein [Notoacmeibacter sp.]